MSVGIFMLYDIILKYQGYWLILNFYERETTLLYKPRSQIGNIEYAYFSLIDLSLCHIWESDERWEINSCFIKLS